MRVTVAFNIRYLETPSANHTPVVISDQLIASIDNGYRQASNHNINFDAGHLSSGVYIYRLTISNIVLTKKMTLIK